MYPPPSGPNSPTGDETLLAVARAQDGGREEVEALVTRMGGRVLAMVLLRMSPNLRGRIEPEEVVQEVWAEAIASLPSFDPGRGAPFGAWLSTIVRRTLGRLDRAGVIRRPRRSEASAPALLAVSALLERPASQTTPSQAVSLREGVERLTQAIRRLPEAQQEVVTAYWLEERCAAEVAERTGRSRGAVYMILTRANRRLASLLDAGGLGPFPT